jgi:hypothetical protein
LCPDSQSVILAIDKVFGFRIDKRSISVIFEENLIIQHVLSLYFFVFLIYAKEGQLVEYQYYLQKEVNQ